MMKHEIFDHESKHPPLPGHKEHRCTDLGWLFVFFLALGGLGYIQFYAWHHGDLRRLSHGYNYHKEMCGVNASVSDKAFVYWCKDMTGQNLALNYPTCVASCPTDASGYTNCFDPTTHQLTEIPTYPTRPVGRYCLPTETNLSDRLGDKLVGKNLLGQIARVIDILRHTWMLPASAGVVAVIIGYAYLFLLDHYAGPLVKVCMVLLVVGPMALGAFFIWQSLSAGGEKEKETGLNDAQYDLIFGGSLIVTGLVMAVVACCFHTGTDTAVGCIEAACECMFQEPTLLLEPFISLASKAFTLVIMGLGFVTLAACGNVVAGENGVMRSFSWSPEEYGYAAYMVFMLLWLLELSSATSQYVLAWATQMWYFTPYVNSEKIDVPSWSICKGYANAITFHLGTLALGSLLIAFLRFIRMVLAYLASTAQAQGNCVGACIAKCCVCFISCFKNFIEFLNKNAYMDVAITSEGFCASAVRAMEIIGSEVPAVALLNGAQVIFQIAGMGIITSVPTILVYIACKRMPTFSDPQSSLYVEEPKWVAVAAAIVSGVIAASFMVVFDTVGDTILYCFATDERRHHERRSSSQAMQSSRSFTSDESSEQEQGFFGWLFGAGESIKEQAESLVMEEKVEYAPPRLRQLIEDHE